MVGSGLCKNIPTCECSVFSLCIIGWMGSFPLIKLTAQCRKACFPPEAKRGVLLLKKKKKFQENDSVHFSSVNWMVQFSSVAQSCLLLCDPWTAARQASLSITNSHSLLKLMSLESVVPSNHLILCRPLLFPPSIFPSISVFSMRQFFASGGQRIGVSASASVLPMNIQSWFLLGLTGLISLQSKGLSRVFSNTTV